MYWPVVNNYPSGATDRRSLNKHAADARRTPRCPQRLAAADPERYGSDPAQRTQVSGTHAKAWPKASVGEPLAMPARRARNSASQGPEAGAARFRLATTEVKDAKPHHANTEVRGAKFHLSRPEAGSADFHLARTKVRDARFHLARPEMRSANLSTSWDQCVRREMPPEGAGRGGAKCRPAKPELRGAQFHFVRPKVEEAKFHLATPHVNDAKIHLARPEVRDAKFHLDGPEVVDTMFHLVRPEVKDAEFHLVRHNARSAIGPRLKNK